ncbi:hypothetical protein LBSG162_16450 [Lentilactobacillus buchneri subsp. silagei]|uniref:Uncharacterized protein n=2 Tax=Lactobacillaceae TaxID=33958 RepID=A0A0R1NPB5_9LACO|nr:hypothetical protein [Lentilactobacillus hilgardii]KRL20116.1 hypothetical protein FC98_GL001870 [Lentilactobacillus kisonensis DSM 19906 = JCM 15041]MDM7515209.1 hypothetical protein [Lentilactobacillus sp. TOM.63]OBU97809.1 hypothetical protein A7B51_00090 [Lentilactobacillus parabuchneri]GED92540.1 hypothetical protein LBSG162_16450 [Lentilactobacillus buchneri subsp. silagei]DAJ07221.1 MAG TPA: hypothetical protein [Caudoviricetes sp.]HAT54182.1 hypothetical protein [Lactobacillus sp.]
MCKNLTNHFIRKTDLEALINKSTSQSIGWTAYIYNGLESGLPRPIKYMNADELSVFNWAISKRMEVQSQMRGGF